MTGFTILLAGTNAKNDVYRANKITGIGDMYARKKAFERSDMSGYKAESSGFIQ